MAKTGQITSLESTSQIGKIKNKKESKNLRAYIM